MLHHQLREGEFPYSLFSVCCDTFILKSYATLHKDSGIQAVTFDVVTSVMLKTLWL